MFAGKVIAITGASVGIGAEPARQILAATHARKRQLVMTLQARIGLWLQLIAPHVVDNMVLKKLKKDLS